MGNTVLATGISVYWPLLLVGTCGVVLVIIALLALLLMKGQDDLSAIRKTLHTSPARKKQKRYTAANKQYEVLFYRIGRDTEAQRVSLEQDQWYAVGSGKRADFCLDSNDGKLAKRHFQICVKGSVLLVDSLEEETFVNGVPIRKLGTVQAASGDLIRAGSHEYRVIYLPSEEKENAT